MTARMLTAFALAGLLLTLAGCGDDEAAPPPTPSETTSQTTTHVESTPSPTATPEPSVRTIRLFVEQGRPRGGIASPVLKQGERVRIVIRTDAGMEVHLHGYDITRPVRPGQPTQLAFTADIPGRFELELHHPDAVLADLEVRP